MSEITDIYKMSEKMTGAIINESTFIQIDVKKLQSYLFGLLLEFDKEITINTINKCNKTVMKVLYEKNSKLTGKIIRKNRELG